MPMVPFHQCNRFRWIVIYLSLILAEGVICISLPLATAVLHTDTLYYYEVSWLQIRWAFRMQENRMWLRCSRSTAFAVDMVGSVLLTRKQDMVLDGSTKRLGLWVVSGFLVEVIAERSKRPNDDVLLFTS